jgi:hypothetical protein
MTLEEKQQAVRELIDDLPEDRNEIASLLVSEGVVGCKGNIYHCPLAIYLSERAGFLVRVASDWVSIPGVEGSERKVDLPSYVTEFIEQVDNGYHPSLLRRPSP